MLEWMLWTEYTLVGLLLFVLLLVTAYYCYGLRRRETPPRKGFLHFQTTPGERIFLGFYTFIVVSLITVIAFESLPVNITGAIAGLVLGVIIFLYG